jgi:iron complex outermembrane receptor protein
MQKITLLLLGTLFSISSIAQTTVKGTVSDKNNSPISGANIVEDGTSNGSLTDFDGNYTITVQDNATLVISLLGYETKSVKVNGQTTLNITLAEGLSLDEVVVVGSRTAPRSQTDTALPVDVLTSEDIQNTGQVTFDKALQYKIPSFNTVQTPVNDATSLLDPYEIRNMGQVEH